MSLRGCALVLLLSAVAQADATPPPEPAAPKCHDATWRGIERAFASYCKDKTGSGVHGSCADWLRAYRRCNGTFERTPTGWSVVIKLFDCHDPVVDAVPDGKGWRVRGIKMRSYMPMPIPRPGPGDIGEPLPLE
jgi:hypothetical protein